MTETAHKVLAASDREDQRSSFTVGRRNRRKFLQVEDLATHPEIHLAPEQLARYWNVDVQTIRRWVRGGILVGKRLGRAIRVPRTAAIAFEEKQQLRKAG